MLTAPISQVKSTNYTTKPSFKAIMNSVRYVNLDGCIVEDKKIIEKVVKQFVKRLKEGNIENKQLSDALIKEMPEYCPYAGYQTVKFLKLNTLGRNFNIIIGAPAHKLKLIWEQAGVALETKKAQASNIVKSIIHGPSHKQIALQARSENVKGKTTKYIVENIYTTA